MRTFRLAAIVLAAVTTVGACQAPPGAEQDERLLFVGTYTVAPSKGIYAFRFNDRTGTLSALGLAAEATNPSFLAASPDQRFLFAVNETATYGEKSGSVTSFAVDTARGSLNQLSVTSSRGADPCHLAVDRTGRFVAIANYSGGNVAVLSIGADGRLGLSTSVQAHRGSGPNAARQAAPYAHAVAFTADNRFLLAADLGIDRVLVYRFDEKTGVITPHDPPGARVAPGAGPRHLAWHPDGHLAFSIDELASTITTFAWDALQGALTSGATVRTLPAGFTGDSFTAEIEVHPSGRFVYGSNRGHDSIAAFAVGAAGSLALVEIESTRGRTPRSFTIDRTGRWLLAANQDTGTLAVFQIDQKTGALAPVGEPAKVPSPVSLLFVS
jgi:6-phosphogluconolactonase